MAAAATACLVQLLAQEAVREVVLLLMSGAARHGRERALAGRKRLV